MAATLQALGGILLNALPTFILVVLLHFYLKSIFFKPLGKVLHERYLATAGARLAAEKSLERAAAKTAEYESAMRAARGEVYQAQEQLHRQLQERETTEMAAARKRGEELLQAEKARILTEMEAAKAYLARESELLANQVTDAILRRSAA